MKTPSLHTWNTVRSSCGDHSILIVSGWFVKAIKIQWDKNGIITWLLWLNVGWFHGNVQIKRGSQRERTEASAVVSSHNERALWFYEIGWFQGDRKKERTFIVIWFKNGLQICFKWLESVHLYFIVFKRVRYWFKNKCNVFNYSKSKHLQGINVS